jgi:hypothetical protein
MSHCIYFRHYQDQPAPYNRKTLVHEWFSLVEYQTTVNKNLL